MSYVKSLRRERKREGTSTMSHRTVEFWDDEDEDVTPLLRVSNRRRNSLDRKLRAAYTRDMAALIEVEWDD